VGLSRTPGLRLHRGAMPAPDPTPYPLDTLPSRGASDAPALVLKGETLSYAALEARVGALAAWLGRRGYAPGDRVASWLPKTATSCLLPLAAPRAGLVHVPINPVLKAAQARHILSDSGARVLIANPARVEALGDHGLALDIQAGEPEPGDERLPPSEAAPDALAAILYTSGSTGRPKGVMLSHANLWLGAVAVAHYLELGPADGVLAALPLAFDYGQNQLLSAWAAGAWVQPCDYLDPRDLARQVRAGITTLAGVPPLWRQLVEVQWGERAARLTRITNSGGALTPALVRRLRETFPDARVYPMYGLTEAFRSTYLPPELVDAHPDAIGRAIPFAEVMAVRPDGGRAAPGEPAELVHAGPLVAKGYWRDPERTAARFRPAPAFSAMGGTAVWSGDTVTVDADGLFRFVGRDDETIKSSGYRISPAEVEEAALAGGEAREAVAVGVPDERLGQAIALVLEGDAAAEPALRARLKALLPTYLQPGRYRWEAALPRNANGKIDRAAVRAALLPAPAPATGAGGLDGAKPLGPLPAEFADQKGPLRIGGRPYGEWIAKAGDTPLFVYDAGIVSARIRRFRAAVPATLRYAVKANPFPPLVAAIAAQVGHLDVASGGELALVGGMVPAGAISFAGPGKRDDELAAALDAGVVVNLESEGEWDRLQALGQRRGRTPRVAVRVNPDLELRGSGMRMGGRASPFGVDAERVPALVRRIVASGAAWDGFHVFAGSQSLDTAAIIETQAATVALAARLAEAAGEAPAHLNLGGGFGIPYFAGDRPIDVEAIGAALGERRTAMPAVLAATELGIELGRWLVGEAGVYLTRVVDRKESRGELFLVTDGGLHHQLAASGNFGTVVRRNYPLAVAGAMGAPAAEVASVVGCLCTPLDRLADRAALPRADTGDVVAVFAAGAYGLSASPVDFLGHPHPAQVLAQPADPA
jgi:acyl-CoA ligase (AMP-forming) (exosortase A-associated)/pyridoxal-dependent decarboxylase (exosortase A-associated)